MIKKTILLLTIHLIFVAVYGQKNEENAILKTFNNYKSSILNDKGGEAVNYLDSRTIGYYNDILVEVKEADSLAIEAMNMMDKLMVLSVRHRTSKEKILSFDGKKLLIYAIEQGMVGKNSVKNNSIGEVIIEDDFAKGQLISNGQETPLYFHFYKEAGMWKLDLTSIFSMSNMAFKQVIEQSGHTENEYLFMILEMITGKKPQSTIWEPIVI